MRPLRIRNLAAVALVFAAVGWSFQGVWISQGRQLFAPPLSLSIVLVALGVVVLLMSLPVRRRTHGGKTMINPFYAVRVLAFAQACALTGAIFVGLTVGLIVFQLTLTINTFGQSWWLCVTGAGASLILLVLALLAERFCRIPPQSGDDERTASPPAPEGAA